jgi:hypothetical protein
MNKSELTEKECLEKDVQTKSEIIVKLLGLITETGNEELRDRALEILKATTN